jgi:hypothetical protein
MEFVFSHPSRNNKYAASVGYPDFLLSEVPKDRT